MRRAKATTVEVRPVEWLKGIAAIVVGETVYVAKQKTRRTTRMLAEYAYRLSQRRR